MEISSFDQLEFFNAVIDGRIQEVRALIQKGVNVNSKDYGETPLPFAVRNGKEAVVELLLKKGAKIDETDSIGMTSLQIAAFSDQLSSAKILLKHGADTEIKGRFSYTPLHLAIQKHNVSIVKLLLKYGADVNSLSNGGLTPLMRTIGSKKHVISEVLLQNGAKPEVKGKFGPTVHFTISQDYMKSFELLLRYGASLNIKNEYVETPLEVALTKVYNTDHKLHFLKVIFYHQHQ